MSRLRSRLLLLQPLRRHLRSLRRSSGKDAGWLIATAHDADDLHRRLHAAHIDDQHRTGVILPARVAGHVRRHDDLKTLRLGDHLEPARRVDGIAHDREVDRLAIADATKQIGPASAPGARTVGPPKTWAMRVLTMWAKQQARDEEPQGDLDELPMPAGAGSCVERT